MLEYDWEHSVGHWICTTSHALRRALSAQLSQEGITLRQWEVLAWLSCNGCGSQAQLADALGIEPHTLAGVLNRMVRDGFLERKSCDRDRRKNLIRPTPRAESIWSRVTHRCHLVRDQALQGIPAEELETFRRVCERIRENVAEGVEATPVEA